MAEAILARTGVWPGAVDEAIGQAIEQAEEQTRAALALKADKARQISLTLPASGWTGDVPPYTQAIPVEGLGAEQAGFMGLAQTATAEQREAAAAAQLCVTSQAAGTITIAADGDKPGMDIPCAMTLLG